MVATQSNLFQFFSWLRRILMTSKNLHAGGKVRSCPRWQCLGVYCVRVARPNLW
jgi:hypothetical protein